MIASRSSPDESTFINTCERQEEVGRFLKPTYFFVTNEILAGDLISIQKIQTFYLLIKLMFKKAYVEWILTLWQLAGSIISLIETITLH